MTWISTLVGIKVVSSNHYARADIMYFLSLLVQWDMYRFLILIFGQAHILKSYSNRFVEKLLFFEAAIL